MGASPALAVWLERTLHDLKFPGPDELKAEKLEY